MKSEDLPHVLAKPVSFTAGDGNTYSICPLTQEIAQQNASAILAIHNLIPKVKWAQSDLLGKSTARGERSYLGKWRLSFIVKHEEEIVALLIAYVRGPSERHPMAAVYVHRIAVHVGFQRRGIGTQLLAFATAVFFETAPWLLTVSVQTNDTSSNRHVIRLYERLHFRCCYRISYPDKEDWLLEVPRSEHLASGFAIPEKHLLKVPAFATNCISSISDPLFRPDSDSAPTVYFGTGSHEKREQYRYLLRCYGLELLPLTHTLKLSEPQVEGVGSVPESALVTAPLKLYSRFAAALENTYPVVVEDTMLFIEHFNNDYARSPILPGADTKRWWRTLGAPGVLRTMQGSKRRKATYVCQLGLALRSTSTFASISRAELRARSDDQPLRSETFPTPMPRFSIRFLFPTDRVTL